VTATGNGLQPPTVTRLAFIRQLYQQGLEQAHLPEPLALTSVLTFHDAVELFLILAAEHAGLPRRPREFRKYWAELAPAGITLTGELPMERLNRLRTDFKHLGTMPHPAAIEQARSDVTGFFEDNTPVVFSIRFDGVEMTDLIPQPALRDKAKAATAAAVAGDRIEAMGLLAEAMDELLDGPRHQRPDDRTQMLTFGPNLHWPLDQRKIHAVLRQPDPQPRHMPVRGAEELARQISALTEIAIAAQAALRISILGLDYRQYHRFQQLTPRIHRVLNGGIARSSPPGYDPNQLEFDYCRQFLITAALRLSQLEPHTAPPPLSSTPT
jgi:hypothetical protein